MSFPRIALALRRSFGIGIPCRNMQRDPQAPEGAGMARAPPAPDVPLHANIVLMAERGRNLLIPVDPSEAATRHLSLGRRSAGCYQPLRRRNKPSPETFRVDSRPGTRPRRRKTWETSVRVGPLGCRCVQESRLRHGAAVLTQTAPQRKLRVLPRYGNTEG